MDQVARVQVLGLKHHWVSQEEIFKMIIQPNRPSSSENSGVRLILGKVFFKAIKIIRKICHLSSSS